MWRNVLAVGVVAAVGVAALLDTLRGGSPLDERAESATEPLAQADANTLTGPDVPAAGALSGSLVVAESDGCRLRVIAFATASLGDPGPVTLCRVWVSPAGDLAVVTTDRGDRSDAREIALVRLTDPPEVVESLGQARGEIAWESNGDRLAWCAADGTSIVLSIEAGTRQRIEGCRARFAPDGAVLTKPDRPLVAEILRNGEPLLGPDEIAGGFPQGSSGPVNVLDFAIAHDGRMAVTATRTAPLGTVVVLELWQEGLEATYELPAGLGPGNTRFGGFLRFSPVGSELAIGYTPGAGELTLVDVELGRLLVRSTPQRALSWSPDGAWLALATDDEVRIYGALRDEPSYVLPLGAAALGWTAWEEPPDEG
jgi:hypothetical protein